MAKKDDEIETDSTELLADIACDRDRLSAFLDRLLAIEDTTIIAEPVARIADSLTKQNMLRVTAIKAKIRARVNAENDEDEVFEEIGRPFVVEEEEGSNN